MDKYNTIQSMDSLTPIHTPNQESIWLMWLVKYLDTHIQLLYSVHLRELSAMMQTTFRTAIPGLLFQQTIQCQPLGFSSLFHGWPTKILVSQWIGHRYSTTKTATKVSSFIIIIRVQPSGGNGYEMNDLHYYRSFLKSSASLSVSQSDVMSSLLCPRYYVLVIMS